MNINQFMAAITKAAARLGDYWEAKVVAGSVMDSMTTQVHSYGLVMPLCVSYLAASELLSIIENLDDAGVSAVHDLIAIIKRRRN